MKNIVIVIGLVLLCNILYAQQFLGGGSGTAEDPYQIWNREQWEEFASVYCNAEEGDDYTLSIGFVEYFGHLHPVYTAPVECSQPNVNVLIVYDNLHFRLMEDISDVRKSFEFEDCKFFGGYFHGGGHKIYVDSLRTIDTSLFPENTRLIDSLTITTNRRSGVLVPICYANFPYAEIKNCTSDLGEVATIDTSDISPGTFVYVNQGLIEDCVNYTDVIVSSGVGFFGGICGFNYAGVLRRVINYGDISVGVSSGFYSEGVGGICYVNDAGIIEDCVNYGDINALTSGISDLAGICSTVDRDSQIRNCINAGDIVCSKQSGDVIVSGIATHANSCQNCLNVGTLHSDMCASGIAYDCREVKNCLNVGFVSSSQILPSAICCYQPNTLLESNYYDRQMCMAKAINGNDSLDVAEGRLTKELIADSIMGDGWSYALGRYPIPLGLEDTKVAQLAASPVILYSDEDTVENINTVSNNFNVGTLNGVSWEFESNHATILDLDGIADSVLLVSYGSDVAICHLDDLVKRVNLRIDYFPVSVDSGDAEYGLSIFPNPSNGTFTLELPENSSAELIDLSGKRIAILQKENSLSIPSGVYVVKVVSDYGVEAKKIVIE